MIIGGHFQISSFLYHYSTNYLTYLFILFIFLFIVICLEWPHRDNNSLPLVEPSINQTVISMKTNDRMIVVLLLIILMNDNSIGSLC